MTMSMCPWFGTVLQESRSDVVMFRMLQMMFIDLEVHWQRNTTASPSPLSGNAVTSLTSGEQLNKDPKSLNKDSKIISYWICSRRGFGALNCYKLQHINLNTFPPTHNITLFPIDLVRHSSPLPILCMMTVHPFGNWTWQWYWQCSEG